MSVQPKADNTLVTDPGFKMTQLFVLILPGDVSSFRFLGSTNEGVCQGPFPDKILVLETLGFVTQVEGNNERPGAFSYLSSC